MAVTNTHTDKWGRTTMRSYRIKHVVRDTDQDPDRSFRPDGGVWTVYGGSYLREVMVEPDGQTFKRVMAVFNQIIAEAAEPRRASFPTPTGCLKEARQARQPSQPQNPRPSLSLGHAQRPAAGSARRP